VNGQDRWKMMAWSSKHLLGRVLINRHPNADLDALPNVRDGGKADKARTYQYVR